MPLENMDARLRQIANYFLAQKTSATVNPGSIGARLLPHLYVLDLERDATESTVRLRIRLTGTAIDQAFGRPLVGCNLEDFMHGPRAKDVIEAFHRCAKTHEPLWMRQIAQLQERSSKLVERVPRFIEGVAIYLKPEHIYGGLIVGEAVVPFMPGKFECTVLSRS